MIKLFPSRPDQEEYVTCIRCGQSKPASAFNTDNGKSNGLTSYCKECNKMHAQEWKQKAQSKKEQRDLVELYCQAYVEGYHKSTSPYPTRKAKDANIYADTVFPEAASAKEAYMAYTRSRGVLSKTPEVELGSLITHSLRGLIPKAKVSKPRKEKKEFHFDSVKGKYEAWILNNDFMPSDEFVSHFTGVTIGHLQDTRADLRKVGYEFQEVESGWAVTQRPVVVSEKNLVENVLNNMSIEELIALVARKLNG